MAHKEGYRDYVFPIFDIFVEKTDGLIPSVFVFEIHENDLGEALEILKKVEELKPIHCNRFFMRQSFYRRQSTGDVQVNLSKHSLFYDAAGHNLDLFYIEKLKCLVAVRDREIYDGPVYIELYYSMINSDCSELKVISEKLKELTLRVHKKVRTPKIDLLIKDSMGALSTKEVNLNINKLELDKIYNDDIIRVNEKVQTLLDGDDSGLVLFHGMPGTGKSTYLKHLSTMTDREIIFIPSNLVGALSDPSFVSFLLYRTGCVLIIEDAEKALESRDHNHNSAIVSTILNLTDGILGSALKVKIFATFNCDIDKIDKALTRKGRLVCEYEFKELHKDKADKLLESRGLEKQGKNLTIAEIFSQEENVFSKKEQTQRVIGFN